MTPPTLVLADLRGFADAVGQFLAALTDLQWGVLLLALGLYGVTLTLRSRAALNIIRAAYPGVPIRWRHIWGAYAAAYGANAVLPARPGDLVRLFLVHRSVPGSSYPTVASSFLVENIFDTAIGVLMMIFAFTQGVFPKPPDFPHIGAFELSYLAARPRLTLFLLTALAVLVLVAFALLSVRVRAFWQRVRQGVVILTDRRRYLREVVAFQLAGWGCRFASIWLLLEAFGIGGSVRNTLLVFGVYAVTSLVPLAPGGAGVQQALLVKVFAAEAATAQVAAYSVGQQIALAAFSFGLGFVALVAVFRLRSFRAIADEVRGRRAAEAAASS